MRTTVNRYSNSDLKNKIKKQVEVLNGFLSLQRVITGTLRRFDGEPVDSKFKKSITSACKKILPVGLFFRGAYFEVLSSNRTFKRSDGCSETVPTAHWEIELELDENGTIDAHATIALLGNEISSIKTMISDLESSEKMVKESNEEWEDIKKRVESYRSKYPSFILRNDLY